MKKIEIKAPAKINIGLNIVSKREDGYHNLETFFYPIHDLYDHIVFEKADSFSFSCSAPELDNDSNLIIKAVRLLEEIKKMHVNVSITCEKNIPAGAGLGGGSSDAAAVLLSLNEMYYLGLKYEELVTLALLLGSDVPFFLKSKPAAGKSRGEKLIHLPVEIDRYILLVNPGIHISTGEAFSSISPTPSNIEYEKVFGVEKLDIDNALKDIRNDFEESVFARHPEIKEIKDMMYKSGACFSLMSGSGSTVYGFFKALEDAEKAKGEFPSSYFTFVSRPENYFF